jgi:hypothetical protein
LGLECAIAVAQQHTHGVAIDVGHGEVGNAVAVEVSFRDGFGVTAYGVGDLRLKGAVAVAEQDVDGGAERVGKAKSGLPSPLRSHTVT